jgi:hypothetical protein
MASFEEGQRLYRLRSIAQLGSLIPGKTAKVPAVWRLKAYCLRLEVGWPGAEGYDGRADT